MDKTVTINVRTDAKTRQELKKFAQKIGVPASSLINASIKDMLRRKSVSFTTTPQPTPYLEHVIKEAEADYKAGKNFTKTTTIEETLAHLRSL